MMLFYIYKYFCFFFIFFFLRGNILYTIYILLFIYVLFFLLVFFFISNVLFGIFLYSREVWDEWDWTLDLIEWKVQYFYYEVAITGLSDVFWGDCFFPEDNYMYPEFRFFFIYTEDIVLYWA